MDLISSKSDPFDADRQTSNGSARAVDIHARADRQPWADVQTVPIRQVDRKDMRFQLRLETRSESLLGNLREHGQRTPVILWGRTDPYAIIDGFRRIEAMTMLGYEKLNAIIRTDLDESQAFALSFSENCQRASLQPRDKAYAVWLAIQRWGIHKRDVAAAFGLSVRQIDRYLKLFDLPNAIMDAVSDERISFAHALTLDQFNVRDPEEWVRKIEETQLSADELRQKLKPRRAERGPRSYLVRDAVGFRLKQIRYRRDMPLAQKRRIWDALDSALHIMADTS